MRQIALDTETTGLRIEEGHRIIEIGCVELIDRKLTGRTFHQYLCPERLVDQEAMAVHGITDHFLKDKPLFREIASDLMAFMEGAELIIHNAPFDLGFLNHEYRLLGRSFASIETVCSVTDTLVMARQLHTGQRNSLDALCKRYGIDASHREWHGALLDANLLAHVYLAMTGGQADLFDGFSVSNPSTQEQMTTDATQSLQSMAGQKISNTHALRVIYATSDELSGHENQLQDIAKKGKCLWLRDY